MRRAAACGLLCLLAAARPATAAPDESVTVTGHRSRFQPMPQPVPNPRFDPPGSPNALHDSDTGADLGNFGPAYSAATPAPPINPALRSDLQNPMLHVGNPR